MLLWIEPFQKWELKPSFYLNILSKVLLYIKIIVVIQKTDFQHCLQFLANIKSYYELQIHNYIMNVVNKTIKTYSPCRLPTPEGISSTGHKF